MLGTIEETRVKRIEDILKEAREEGYKAGYAAASRADELNERFIREAEEHRLEKKIRDAVRDELDCEKRSKKRGWF